MKNQNMNQQQIGICRLCGLEAELQCSHILPAAAHRATKVAGRNVYLTNQLGGFNLKNQRDIVEKLLCFACEQKLSALEGEAITVCHAAREFQAKPFYEIPAKAIRPLIGFAYSVFWRASVASRLDYKLKASIEDELRAAFYDSELPAPPQLSISVSFFKIMDLPLTGSPLLTPWVAALPLGVTAHYFTMLGIVFRMDLPSALHELEDRQFLRAAEKTGRVYHLLVWEAELIEKMMTKVAVIAKAGGA